MLGQVIREARRSRGLSQRQVAANADMAASNVSAIEHDRRVPTVETLQRLLGASGFHLVATAGDTVIPLPHPDDPPDRAEAPAPTVTSDTPIEERVRVLLAVLRASETIVRSRR